MTYTSRRDEGSLGGFYFSGGSLIWSIEEVKGTGEESLT